MKSKFILGAAFASAGLAALIGGDSFALAPGNVASFGGGSTRDVCVSAGTAYSGASFMINITTLGGEEPDFTAQVYLNDFDGQQCKSVRFPQGGYKATLYLPGGASDVYWNAGSIESDNRVEFTVNTIGRKYLLASGDASHRITATATTLKRGREVNLALKQLAGTSATYAIDEDTNITNISFVDTLPEWIDPETADKVLVSDGAAPIYAYNGGSGKIYIHKGSTPIMANRDSSYLFAGMSELTDIDFGDDFDTSSVTDMSGMFEGASSMQHLTLPETFNTSNVVDMSSMFEGMSSLQHLTLPETFNTSNVVNMSSMFAGLSGLSRFVVPNGFDTSNVETMSYMFSGMSSAEMLAFISPQSNFDTSNVTDMTGMFSGMTSLTTLYLGDGFNTSNVVSMAEMFKGDEALKELSFLHDWNTSSVEDMHEMFFDTGITTAMEMATRSSGSDVFWDVSNVKDMSGMFAAAHLLTDIGSLGSWDVSNVENMAAMFTGWTGSEDKWMSLSDISALASWDTSSVTNMSTMFRSNKVLKNISALERKQHAGNDYVSWDVSNVNTFVDMFMGVPSITTFAPLESWGDYVADDASQYAMFYGIPFSTARPSWYNGDGDGEL